MKKETLTKEEVLEKSKFTCTKNKPVTYTTKSGVKVTTEPNHPYTIWNNGRKVAHIEKNIKNPGQVGKAICEILNTNKNLKLIIE